MMTVRIVVLATLIIGAPVLTGARAQTGGVTHVDTVPAPSLRANLVGDPDRRAMTVYLPPSYRTRPLRRYPVIYLLHGFAADHRAFIRGAYQNLNIRLSMDSLIRAGAVREMIVVTPNAQNAYDGSFYANSPVTGNWEDFIVRDLVSFVDRKYRTVRSANGRGIAGHSMGGHGALRIGMRNPEIFSAMYGMSACCLSLAAGPLNAGDSANWRRVIAVDDRQKFDKAGFLTHVFIAFAAVNSPNPQRPPLYVDLPYRLAGSELVVDSAVVARWRNGPIATAATYASNLLRLNIGFDAGTADGFRDIPVNAARFDSVLTQLGIPHMFELYEGTHGSRIRSRLETKVLPFFSARLGAVP